MLIHGRNSTNISSCGKCVRGAHRPVIDNVETMMTDAFYSSPLKVRLKFLFEILGHRCPPYITVPLCRCPSQMLRLMSNVMFCFNQDLDRLNGPTLGGLVNILRPGSSIPV